MSDYILELPIVESTTPVGPTRILTAVSLFQSDMIRFSSSPRDGSPPVYNPCCIADGPVVAAADRLVAFALEVDGAESLFLDFLLAPPGPDCLLPVFLSCN